MNALDPRPPAPPSSEASRAPREWLRALSLLLILLGLFLIARALPTAQIVSRLSSWVGALGVFGPLLFGLAYVAAALLFVPGAALTLAAGALFDLGLGTLVVSLSSTTAAALAYLIARHLARDVVSRAAAGSPRFAAIDRAIGAGGWKIIFLLRLSPAVPFSLGNYLFGLTAVRFVPYVLASWIGMLPGTFAYVYFGYAGKLAASAASGAAESGSAGRTALLVVGLLATLAVTILITRTAARAMRGQAGIGGALPREGDARETEPSAASARAQRSSRALPLVALIVLATGVLATWKATALQGLFGPPRVALAEVYERRSDGPDHDHSSWDALLRAHVNGAGGVDYTALAAAPSALDAYIAGLAGVELDPLGRDQRLALLINAYNAFTVRLILDHLPLDSIRDIPAAERWDAVRWRLAGRTLSLNQIEHEEIRPRFRDARIHFALVCAAVGCPPLRAEAYVASRLEEQLADQARFVHAGARWLVSEPDSDRLQLSALYDWYGDDFAQDAGATSVLPFVARYHPPTAERLERRAPPRITFLSYDWSLNSRQNLPEPRR